MSDPAAVVRRAGPDDALLLSDLESEAFPDPWRAAHLAELAAGTGGGVTTEVLRADVDGDLAGHAVLSVVFEVAELQRIAVARAYQRTGVGRLLLDAVRERAVAAGAERLLLEVREDNLPALRLYASAGFVEIDRRARYYADGTTAVVLQLDLVPPAEPGG